MKFTLLVVTLFAALTIVSRADAAGSCATAQASNGVSVYVQSCASCHSPNLQGEFGPPLIGPTLKAAHGAATAAQSTIVSSPYGYSEGGVLVTAGDVVFMGEGSGWFDSNPAKRGGGEGL